MCNDLYRWMNRRSGSIVRYGLLPAYGNRSRHVGPGRLFEKKYILAVLRPSEKLDSLVHRDQDSFFFHGESKQIRIGDLLVPEDPLKKGRG